MPRFTKLLSIVTTKYEPSKLLRATPLEPHWVTQLESCICLDKLLPLVSLRTFSRHVNYHFLSKNTLCWCVKHSAFSFAVFWHNEPAKSGPSFCNKKGFKSLTAWPPRSCPVWDCISGKILLRQNQVSKIKLEIRYWFLSWSELFIDKLHRLYKINMKLSYFFVINMRLVYKENWADSCKELSKWHLSFCRKLNKEVVNLRLSYRGP